MRNVFGHAPLFFSPSGLCRYLPAAVPVPLRVLSYSHTPLLIVLIVPVHSYLFSICPVYSDRSCYLFLYLPISLCLYLSYVLHIYDVGVKISRLCCLRIAQPVLPSRFSRSFFITRYSLLFTVFRFSSSIFAISSSCLSSKNLRTTMARSFGSRFSIARFKSIFS